MEKKYQTTRAERIKEIVHEGRTGITLNSLLQLEKALNEKWTKHNICFVLTGTHILERLKREEHKTNPVTFYELSRIFNEFTKRYLWYFTTLPLDKEHYGVIKEPLSHINIGFVLRPGIGISGFDRDFMLQTILRKDRFGTNNKVYQV